ncbi:ABC transporter substrate-binding protein [Brachybacterium sp. UMB0905]|uniref:ABC transporter substrate-binding protein n=1 Tax=Brachybacterium sp. UMB0905 TaxID=2069310 RepID=UPI000C804742|nr:ABC transporter substrate-binding protein [Brachybacterium sp. UMB0905]PMC75833.1 amino acid ABC transporter substrate-binding protein [Brachybacterium sp. UMB0905]
MTVRRRDLVRSLGVGVLGAGLLSACGNMPVRGRGGRRRTTTTAPEPTKLEEPDATLVIGQIGASYGRMGKAEDAIRIAIDEARIDVNSRWKGLFGNEISILGREVMTEPGQDLAPIIEDLADRGATVVITSIDEESLIGAMPTFVERGMAVVDLMSSGMTVRDAEVQTANLLVRLSPNERTLAAWYAEMALDGGGDRGGTAGNVALISEDTAQGRSLAYELQQRLQPNNGKLVSEQFYAPGDFGDVGARVKKVLKKPPALLVLNGGAEAAPFLSALYKATLDEGQRPKIEIPTRLSPGSVIDFSREPIAKDLAPECLTKATAFEPGAALTADHENMMLRQSREFLRTGYGYSQHGYDAVMMICLAAQHALSVEGTAIAAGLPAILTGSEKCTDYEMCRSHLRQGLSGKDRTTIAYNGRMGTVELGPQADIRTGELREYSWTEANVLAPGNATGFEDPGA